MPISTSKKTPEQTFRFSPEVYGLRADAPEFHPSWNTLHTEKSSEVYREKSDLVIIDDDDKHLLSSRSRKHEESYYYLPTGLDLESPKLDFTNQYWYTTTRSERSEPPPKRKVITNSQKGRRRKGQRLTWKRELSVACAPSKPSYDKSRTWSARVTKGLTVSESRWKKKTAPKSRLTCISKSSLKVTTKRKVHPDYHKQKELNQGYSHNRGVTPPGKQQRPTKSHSAKRWTMVKRNNRQEKKRNRSCGQVSRYSQYRSKQSKFSPQQPKLSRSKIPTFQREKWIHTTKVNQPRKVMSAKKRKQWLRATTPPAQSMHQIPLVVEQQKIKQVSDRHKEGVCKQKVKNLSRKSKSSSFWGYHFVQLIMNFVTRYLFSFVLGIVICTFPTMEERLSDKSGLSWTHGLKFNKHI